ncbi:TPA: hypothetical protein VJS76_001850, partial [Streptococcus pyogenes]
SKTVNRKDKRISKIAVKGYELTVNSDFNHISLPKSHISCAIAAIVSRTVIYQLTRNQAISHALDGLLGTR